MSNDDAYAAGLLTRALDPATQPPEIQAYLQAELELLDAVIRRGMRVLDVGCGTGRHLHRLRDRLGLGVGVDYERSYVTAAVRGTRAPRLYFIVGDATAMPLAGPFDCAMCLANTWGTMRDKHGVLREMRRLAPRPGSRLLSIFAPASVAPRREWYRRLGHAVRAETDEYLESANGFRSEHFTAARLREIVGECDIRPLTPIAHAVTF